MAKNPSRAFGMLRVCAFALVISGLTAGLWWWRRPLPPPAIGLGAVLSAHAPPEGSGEVLEINGVEVRTRTAHLDQDLDAALPRLRAACISATRDLDEALVAASAERIALSPDDGVEVQRDGDRASITCTTPSGQRRHLHAAATDRGVAVRALSSDGALPVIGAPSDGDAPGRDLAGVPRPEGATRLLSVFTPDGRYAMVQLALPQTGLDAQRAAYVDALREAGFDVRETPGDDGHQRTLILERRARRIIAVMDDGVGLEPILTLLDQGGA